MMKLLNVVNRYSKLRLGALLVRIKRRRWVRQGGCRAAVLQEFCQLLWTHESEMHCKPFVAIAGAVFAQATILSFLAHPARSLVTITSLCTHIVFSRKMIDI